MRRFISFTRFFDSMTLFTVWRADESCQNMELEHSFVLDGVSDLTGMNEFFVCLAEGALYAI